MAKKVLIIGFVWPEPNATAAGSRMLQLIKLFQQQGMEVCFVTAATETPHMATLSLQNVTTQQIQLNHDSFDTYISDLNPDIVLFDRFVVEEQFGWRVSKNCPDAIKILDTEDLHCLRKTRQDAFKKGLAYTQDMLLDSEVTKRELASIYRCDLSLIISTYEMQLLKNTFKIDKSLLCYLPFLLEKISEDSFDELPDFDDRADFMCIGNFRHEPNWNMVLYLKQIIWPLVRKNLPKAKLHVYGAYPSAKVTQLHNDSEGFLVKGWANNVDEVMQMARVCLAPIRFGAGIKGKFTDAMRNGLPSVTTLIGAEGMLTEHLSWSGFIADSPKDIAEKAVQLYNSKTDWRQAQKNGKEIINTQYADVEHQQQFLNCLIILCNDITMHRKKNFIGAMLQHHTMSSTKYLSKWISEKEKSIKNDVK